MRSWIACNKYASDTLLTTDTIDLIFEYIAVHNMQQYFKYRLGN